MIREIQKLKMRRASVFQRIDLEKILLFCSLNSDTFQFESSYKVHYLLRDLEARYFSNQLEKDKVRGGIQLL